ncbi:MAG: CBS and ACT domain-containing protein [Desulfovibrionaceae bacterium]
MLIRNWMTREVITVTPETSMLKASKLMKEHDIRRLPVIDSENHVVGIVSDRDIKDASPSKATTLDMHELYYLLSELKIKSIMTPHPTTVSPTDTVETVAMLMEERGFGGIPVVDDDGKLVGIISDHDVFKVLISITGVRQGGVQLAFNVPDKTGSMRPILDALRLNHASIISILSSNDSTELGTRHVFIRLRPMETAAEDALITVFKEQFNLLYWARNAVHLTEKS